MDAGPAGGLSPGSLFDGLERGALRRDDGHQLVPGLDESGRAFLLQLRRERTDIDAGTLEFAQHGLAVATVRRHRRTKLAMVRECLESVLRHRVDREWRRQRLDV